MKLHRLAATIGFLGCAIGEAAAAPPPLFHVQEVTGIVPAAINDLGDLAGRVGDQAALARAGQVVLLGTLGGATSAAVDLNNADQVTGSSTTVTGDTHAFLYGAGTMRDLGTLGGSTSSGAAINGSGQVTGSSTTFAGASHAFLYDGTMKDLGTLYGRNSAGMAINDAGDVAGWSMSRTEVIGVRSFEYASGVMTDLGVNERLHVQRAEPFGINNRGDVVGIADNNTEPAYPFLVENGASVLLPRLSDNTTAVAINDAGWIVGDRWRGIGPYYAVLFIDRRSYDLQDFLDESGRGLQMNSALDINQAGQILVEGGVKPPGDNYSRPGMRFYVLTPVPEPGTATLLSIGLLILGGVQRSRRALAAQRG